MCCCWLTLVALEAFAEERNTQSDKRIAPHVVNEKSEKLVAALTTTNRPPKIVKFADEGYPVFPADFDWNEYRRVTTAIKNVTSNFEVAWPSLVEHMTDMDYCFTVEWDDAASNDSRGDVCYHVVQSCVRGAYRDLMPRQDAIYQKEDPGHLAPKELQRWCRERRDKKLYEIQIEAAEWALSIIPIERKYPKQLQDRAVSGIRKVVTELRDSRKPISAEYFIVSTMGLKPSPSGESFRFLIGC
jgi:hypothetical protein